jgi:hypothetical protein
MFGHRDIIRIFVLLVHVEQEAPRGTSKNFEDAVYRAIGRAVAGAMLGEHKLTCGLAERRVVTPFSQDSQPRQHLLV